ncbi:N-acetyltransferase [Cedecea sp. P7760]|jgi:putative acetyltransferase|uniref:N-acetyltransferase n=1 Tax=Cedecea TaxID=158483 RepID=UPI0015A0B3B6|nr:N-acetyltransferase [Cedecea sp. P7760]NWC62030.1 N-acetyltransferase [Cedecea sp. P7760]
MIRPFNAGEMDALMALWLESTIDGHPFIAESYWHESVNLVRNVYIPQSKTWVYLHERQLVGFISVMEKQFIGALFVAPSCTGQGIGGKLLEKAKEEYPALSLEVYQKNRQAVHFYHRHGFRIEESAWQEETQHPTWIMSWQADQTPSP